MACTHTFVNMSLDMDNESANGVTVGFGLSYEMLLSGRHRWQKVVKHFLPDFCTFNDTV